MESDVLKASVCLCVVRYETWWHAARESGGEGGAETSAEEPARRAPVSHHKSPLSVDEEGDSTETRVDQIRRGEQPMQSLFSLYRKVSLVVIC